jgi:hypothetical protein
MLQILLSTKNHPTVSLSPSYQTTEMFSIKVGVTISMLNRDEAIFP